MPSQPDRITPDRMAECEWLANSKSIAPAARQAIRDLAHEVKESHAETVAAVEARDRARDAAVALEQENARQDEYLGRVGAIHNGCPNTRDDVICPWCRLAELESKADWLQAVEYRLNMAFHNADGDRVDLNAMTVNELTTFVMAALDGEVPK